jgi:hypothetical protein
VSYRLKQALGFVTSQLSPTLSPNLSYKSIFNASGFAGDINQVCRRQAEGWFIYRFPCVQPAFINATVVPREASKAQKSPCPAITSSSASTSFSICSKVFGMSLAQGVNSSELAPTELKTLFNRCTQRLPKFKHMFRSSFKDCCSFVFLSASASYFVLKSFFSCSKLSDF